MKFWLGASHPSWLNTAPVPLFVSHRAIARTKKLPVALNEWACDSGGFTELKQFGEWRTTTADYTAAVTRYRDEIGNMAWAAPQDWMCEPVMLAKTGLTVAEHQRRTIDNFLTLRHDHADLPFIPVLQGYELDDYLRHVDQYQAAGIDLTAERLVGVGSVCRRQATDEITRLLGTLYYGGLRLHGFGVKTLGLARYSHALASADSMAWGLRGYHTPGCSPTHKNEANCRPFALAWRERVLARAAVDQQVGLPV